MLPGHGRFHRLNFIGGRWRSCRCNSGRRRSGRRSSCGDGRGSGRGRGFTRSRHSCGRLNGCVCSRVRGGGRQRFVFRLNRCIWFSRIVFTVLSSTRSPAAAHPNRHQHAANEQCPVFRTHSEHFDKHLEENDGATVARPRSTPVSQGLIQLRCVFNHRHESLVPHKS